jgi:predicted GNAT family acetyltransferase
VERNEVADADRRAPAISDAPDRERFEAHLDGELAGVLEYVVKRSRIALVHTEVLPAYEGRGVGSALVRFALGEARRRGLRVIATCPYVRSYLARHREDDDIVVPFERHRPPHDG